MLENIWVARERELAVLTEGLSDLRRGEGRLFLITGEPGIGKTRLANELARRAAADEMMVHWGRAWEAGGAPPYWPITQVLRSICRDETSRAAVTSGALTHLLPELRDSDRELELDRFELFNAVYMFLVEAAGRAPRVIILDDLHAADLATLHLLQFLARDLRSAALMLLVTFRDAEARLDGDIGGALAKVAREGVTMALPRLDRGAVVSYIREAIGKASDGIVDDLYARSEGNPLFLRELLRLEGSVVTNDVVTARLALLPSEARELLEAAAVLGREFDLEQLDHEPPRELLETCRAAGIIERVESGWRFTHVLLREGLYTAMPVDRRRALHRAAAARDPTLSGRAHHLALAGQEVATEAARAALQAAARAASVLAFEDACGLLERVGSGLHDGRLRFEVLLGLGVARIRSGEVTRGKETCWEASELARSLCDGELLARAALGMACEFVPGVRDAKLIALLDEALERLPAGDSTLRAKCMAQLAAERQPEPDTTKPIALAKEAVAMARRVGEPDTLRFALSHAGLAMLPHADPSERKLLDEEALRLALAAGDKILALRTHLLLASDCLELGDVAGAEAHMVAYEDLVMLRHERYRWVTVGFRILRAFWAGRLQEAERWYEETSRLLHADEGGGAEMLAFRVGLCRAMNRYDDLPSIEAAVRSSLSAKQGDLGGCIAEMLIAQLHASAGDRVRTTAQLATIRAHPLFGQVREGAWLALLVEPAHLLRDVELAAYLYPLLLPRADRFFTLGPLGGYYEPPYARALGLLAEVLGKDVEAAEHLRDAEKRAAAAKMHWRASAPPGLGEASPKTDTDPSSTRGVLRMTREGEYWTLEWEWRTARMRDSRGLRLLETLVSSPDQEFHVLQLASLGLEDDAGAGEMLDRSAVQRYRQRLLDLREDIEEATRMNDEGRAARAKLEAEALTQELARAVGLGGRERRAGVPAERARTAAQKQLRKAIDRIGAQHRALGVHLDRCIRTGSFCAYFPSGRRVGRRT
jgi:hypothetical protein